MKNRKITAPGSAQAWAVKGASEKMNKVNEQHAEVARQSVTSDIGETSDGYHTFNELYEHRTALFATLCNMRSDISWKSMKHSDGSMFDGMFIAGIETPDGQYTYHCEMKYWYMFAMTKEIDKAPAYDGHQPSDYPRLLALSENSLYRQSVKSEDVAISKTETTGCHYCRGIESHGIATVKTVTDEYGHELGAYDTPYNFCPNCGRKIQEELNDG